MWGKLLERSFPHATFKNSRTIILNKIPPFKLGIEKWRKIWYTGYRDRYNFNFLFEMRLL